MGDGKRGTAPCGHEGEAIIGQFYLCLKGCDRYEPDFELLPTCKCGSTNIDEEFEVDPMYYVFNPLSPIINTRCIDCGRCWFLDKI